MLGAHLVPDRMDGFRPSIDLVFHTLFIETLFDGSCKFIDIPAAFPFGVTQLTGDLLVSL